MTNKTIVTALTLGFLAFTLSALPITTSGLRSEPKPSVLLSAVGVTSDLSSGPSDLVVKVKKKKKKKHDGDGDDITQQGEPFTTGITVWCCTGATTFKCDFDQQAARAAVRKQLEIENRTGDITCKPQ